MSTWGNKVKVDVYGASHAKEMGVTIEGLPKGFELDFNKILKQMERRAPGRSKYATPRKEPDLPIIKEGVNGFVTNGETLKMVIENTNQHSHQTKTAPHTISWPIPNQIWICGQI